MDANKSSGSWGRCAAGLTVVALISGALSFIVAYQMTNRSCASNAPVFSKSPKWEPSGEKVDLPDSVYALYVSADETKCFLLPKTAKGTLVVAEASLSDELVQEIGGLGAYLFCREKTTSLLREPRDYEKGVETEGRVKRVASIDYVPPQGRMPDDEYARRMQGLALDRSEREPRCMDTFIDCGTQVGTVNTCYTGANGIFLMERECQSPTQFQTRMVKPPGRILKILQGELLKCLNYKKVNNEQGRAVRC